MGARRRRRRGRLVRLMEALHCMPRSDSGVISQFQAAPPLLRSRKARVVLLLVRRTCTIAVEAVQTKMRTMTRKAQSCRYGNKLLLLLLLLRRSLQRSLRRSSLALRVGKPVVRRHPVAQWPVSIQGPELRLWTRHTCRHWGLSQLQCAARWSC